MQGLRDAAGVVAATIYKAVRCAANKPPCRHIRRVNGRVMPPRKCKRHVHTRLQPLQRPAMAVPQQQCHQILRWSCTHRWSRTTAGCWMWTPRLGTEFTTNRYGTAGAARVICSRPACVFHDRRLPQSGNPAGVPVLSLHGAVPCWGRCSRALVVVRCLQLCCQLCRQVGLELVAALQRAAASTRTHTVSCCSTSAVRDAARRLDASPTTPHPTSSRTSRSCGSI